MNIERESTCYDEQGKEYVYVCAVPGGHLVSAVLEFGGYYDEPPYTEFGKPEFVGVIHPTAPDHKRAEKIAELDSKIAEKQKELRETEQKLTAFKQEEKGLLDRLKKHESLKRIDDVLSGKITHYAVLDAYAVRLALEDTDRYNGKKYRLLSLLPSSVRGTIHWQINDWSDGSGADRDVVPCTSEEEAIAAIKTEIEMQWSDWLMAENPVAKDRLYEASLDYRVDVPKEYTDFLTGLKRANLLAAIERGRRILANNEKELADLENEHATRS
jgi:hypothetical protein